MTPAEKIASVHIDFDKDNILHELNEEDLPKIGAKKNNYTFVKPMKVSSRNGLDEYGIALLDVDENKDNFEVVHWHWVNEENIKKLKK